MPPVQFIATVTGVDDATLGASVPTFAVPALVRPGDEYIAIVGMVAGGTPIALGSGEGALWRSDFAADVGNAQLMICRRRALPSDPGTIRVPTAGASGFVISGLLVYRGMDSGTLSIVSASNITTSVNFVCPSQNLVRYSDGYAGVVLVTSSDVAVTHPAGTNERHEHGDTARRLEMFDLFPEAPGAVGTKTATTAANRTGIAASFTIPSAGLRGGNKTLTGLYPIPGMLGLPTKGV